ncbi:MAG: hypothetical protein J0H17_03290 [Rhizobiales bacterium]|nr:hypothetical protein [Hyphomicrobiales bacterium]
MSSESSTAKWLRLLPLRWAAGGLLLGTVWTLISSVLQGSLNNPVGGPIAALIRVTLIIILPLTILGFVWGYTERAKLVRGAKQGGEQLTSVIRRTMSREIGKAMLCGLAFGLYVRILFPGRNLLPWDTPERIVTNVSEALGQVLLAIPIGFVVGFFFKRNLFRRFAGIAVL